MWHHGTPSPPTLSPDNPEDGSHSPSVFHMWKRELKYSPYFLETCYFSAGGAGGPGNRHWCAVTTDRGLSSPHAEGNARACHVQLTMEDDILLGLLRVRHVLLDNRTLRAVLNSTFIFIHIRYQIWPWRTIGEGREGLFLPMMTILNLNLAYV